MNLMIVVFCKQISKFSREHTADTDGSRSYALKCNMYMEAQRMRKPVLNLSPKAVMKTVHYQNQAFLHHSLP